MAFWNRSIDSWFEKDIPGDKSHFRARTNWTYPLFSPIPFSLLHRGDQRQGKVAEAFAAYAKQSAAHD